MKSGFTSYDSYLFHEGTHCGLYDCYGAFCTENGGTEGVFFRLWAPNAEEAEVICSATGWLEQPHPMRKDAEGNWECFVPGIGEGDLYRYRIKGADGTVRFKSDPFARTCELRPGNASAVAGAKNYSWEDSGWYQRKKNERKLTDRPVSVYEVHPGSWKRRMNGDGTGTFLNYREYAEQLTEYCTYMGYTHLELIGICEHPFDGSWGYQVSGYFAPTSRYGSPDDFRYFVDLCHRRGIGVILDWVPAHFVKDGFSLGMFDGTHLYEPQDPLMRDYPEWGTYAFDHAKPEVRSFLLSSAVFWIKEFHIDALRFDAVASLLYLDYGRKEWRPGDSGDNRNMAGIGFLKQINRQIHTQTEAATIAEDSSIEAGMTVPADRGGYGFDFKWNLGWMNDSLEYLQKDPCFRTYHLDKMTATVSYTWLEHYILVLSHDEVVHCKHSMIGKIPGTIADKLGTLKAYYTWMYLHPGKKLLFMGQDFGQDREWSEERELDWGLAEDPGHREILQTVRKLNRLYREQEILFRFDSEPASFEWLRHSETDRDILTFLRRDPGDPERHLLCIINFSPVRFTDYAFQVPLPGKYSRLFSTYDTVPGGGGPDREGKLPELFTVEYENGHFLNYSLRPNEAVILKYGK